MVDGGRLLAQSIRIVFALVLAIVAAGFFIAFGLFRALDPATDPVGAGAAFGFAIVGTSVIGGLAFTPAFVGILVSELFRLRGIVFHLAVGGAIGAVMWTMGDGARAGEAAARGMLVPAAAGFVAGFVYWLVAGRQAGCWRVNAPPSTDSDPERSDPGKRPR
ncbi:translation initiation factor IF-3 [Stappia sp. ICDLI1TA098]